MAVDFFLKLEGIDGEAQDNSHGKEIDILSWSWGMSQSGTTHMGSGGGAGKVNVQDLSVTKYVDQSTAPLMLNCCNGAHIPSGKLTCRRAGKNPLEFLVLELKEIIVAAVSTGGIGADDRMTENVTLNFEQFHATYTVQNKDGSAGLTPEVKWDIAKNIESFA